MQEGFDAKNYCQDKLAMNMGGNFAAFGEMPCKPKGGDNIVSNFRPITQ